MHRAIFTLESRSRDALIQKKYRLFDISFTALAAIIWCRKKQPKQVARKLPTGSLYAVRRSAGTSELAQQLHLRPKKELMSIRLRINLVLFAVFFAIAAAGGWYVNHIFMKQSNEHVVKQAAILMESALAVRSYTVDLIKPNLDPLLDEKFLPQTVPAFAATETFERFRKKFPNFKYKEAVLDPTNPRDLADEQERAIIGRFIENPALKDISGELFRNQSRFYYAARPIQIKSPACIVCHDTPERAPATMRQIYGDKGGFGWKLDQVVGAQIIVVPAFEQDAAATELLKIIAMLFAATFAVLLVVINLVLPRQDH